MSSQSFSDITQAQWIKACRKLGIDVSISSGKGSHALAEDPKTGRKYTIQRKLHKGINQKIFKKLKGWGFEDEDIWKAIK